MHLIILFERLYKLHTPKSVSCEKSKAWALSVVLCYLDNVIGFPDTYLLDNDLLIQLHSVEYKLIAPIKECEYSMLFVLQLTSFAGCLQTFAHSRK